MTYNKEQETMGHFLRRGEFRLVFSQLRKAQFSTQRKDFPALLLDLRLFPHPEMHSGCLWLLTRETPLMRAICNYFWLPLGSLWRFVIFLWHFSQTPFNFICKTVPWSSVSLDQGFNFKRSSSFGEMLRCVFRMTFARTSAPSKIQQHNLSVHSTYIVSLVLLSWWECGATFLASPGKVITHLSIAGFKTFSYINICVKKSTCAGPGLRLAKSCDQEETLSAGSSTSCSTVGEAKVWENNCTRQHVQMVPLKASQPYLWQVKGAASCFSGRRPCSLTSKTTWRSICALTGRRRSASGMSDSWGNR